MKILKYFKYGYMVFCRYIIMCLIIVIQITVVTVALNIAVGNYNSRNMLYVPFKDILEKEGYFMMYDRIVLDDNIESIEEDGDNVLVDTGGDYEYISENDVFYDSISKLEGDIGYTEFYKGRATGEYDYIVHVLAVSDDVYNKFVLPLSNGSYSSAVITYNNMYSIGDKLTIFTTEATGSAEIEISGVLTEKTYIPTLRKYSSDMTVTSLYDAFDGEIDPLSGIKERPYLIVPRSLVEQDLSLLTPVEFKFFYYNTPPTDEQREHNETILKSNSGLFMPLSELNERSRIYVNDNLKKVFPVAICVCIIAFFGMLSCICIITVLGMKSNAIFYACGASLKDCIAINMAVILIINCISAIMLTAAMRFINVSGLSAKLGVELLSNNVIISALIYAIMLLLGAVIVVSTFANKNPKQIICSR